MKNSMSLTRKSYVSTIFYDWITLMYDIDYGLFDFNTMLKNWQILTEA